jgi:microcystin-dependent protein
MSNARNLSKAGSSAAGGLAPTGVVLPFAGSTAPTGWLLCFGQAVSRTTYAALFAVLSTTYGAGDGSTTFALPDLRGRVAAGLDNMGGTAASRLTTAGAGLNGAALGAAGGGQTHTLTEAQMPAHTHNANTGSGGGGSMGIGDSGSSSATSSTGGGQAHPNVQPTLITTYIIKT